MTDEKWQNIISLIKDKFKVEKEEITEEEIDKDQAGKAVLEKREMIIFPSPLGRLKLERTTKPLILDKKTKYSQRIGGEVAVNYIYSKEEKVHRFKVYRYSEDDNIWVEIDQKNFNL